MEIRKQMLGIVIGIFLTMSFITPVNSALSRTGAVCQMNVQDLTELLIAVKKGDYRKTYAGYWFD